jgi:hypothetical protein
MSDILRRLFTETWPAKAAKSALEALMLPGQVAGGQLSTQPSQAGMWSDVDEARSQATQQGIGNRAVDLAGLLMGGTYGAAPAGAIGMSGGKLHEYAPMYRPAGSATLPDGFTGLKPATAEHKFGVAQYDKPLSFKDIERFELVPLDPKHPFNLKKSFEGFRDKFMNEFASANETYRGKNGDFMVSPNLSGDGWQVTYFSGKTPTGHHVVDDFDELAREVWGKDFYPR